MYALSYVFDIIISTNPIINLLLLPVDCSIYVSIMVVCCTICARQVSLGMHHADRCSQECLLECQRLHILWFPQECKAASTWIVRPTAVIHSLSYAVVYEWTAHNLPPLRFITYTVKCWAKDTVREFLMFLCCINCIHTQQTPPNILNISCAKWITQQNVKMTV